MPDAVLFESFQTEPVILAGRDGQHIDINLSYIVILRAHDNRIVVLLHKIRHTCTLPEV